MHVCSEGAALQPVLRKVLIASCDAENTEVALEETLCGRTELE